MRRLLQFAATSFALVAVSCAVDFDPIGPGGDPFPDFTPPEEVTPGPPLIVAPVRTDAPLRSLDGGLVARIGSDSLASLAALSGGELLAPVAVLEVSGSLREWLAPSVGGDPAAAATGTLAGRVQEALDAGRYVALRVIAEDDDDLPVGAPTAFGPPGILPDGVWALQGGPPGDDDDSAGDNDDSAGDDDDSAGDDDDTPAPPAGPALLHWADPDLFPLTAGVVTALAGRFADPGVGLAFVTVSGVGLDGAFVLPPGTVDAAGLFSEGSYLATVALYTELWRESFPSVPAYLSTAVVADLPGSRDALVNVLQGDEVSLRDDCFGGCLGIDFARFPDEGSADPYPSSDPFGGWLPAELVDSFGLAYAGGGGGFGAWRFAASTGAWDTATFGEPLPHLERMWAMRARYAPGRFLSVADDACAARWALAIAPVGDRCGAQSAGSHPTILSLARQVEPRLHVARVALPSNWHALSEVIVTVDLGNDGGAASGIDRAVELRLVDAEDLVISSVVLDAVTAGTGAVGPGEVRTLEAQVPIAAAPPAGTVVRLLLRVPEPRAFGGFLPLPHATAPDGWALLATITVPAE